LGAIPVAEIGAIADPTDEVFGGSRRAVLVDRRYNDSQGRIDDVGDALVHFVECFQRQPGND
jgi:hypothetical protein